LLPEPAAEMVSYQQWKTEQENWRRLKALVDGLGRDIREGKVADREELLRRIQAARELCGRLFPGGAALFEMIYPGRFLRQWEQVRRDRD
jgi:hypothetical protein